MALLTKRLGSVGTAIRLIREDRGETVAEAARRVGISELMFSKWEAGENHPAMDSLFRLLDAFGLSLGQFETRLSEARLEENEARLIRLEESIRRLEKQLKDAARPADVPLFKA